MSVYVDAPWVYAREPAGYVGRSRTCILWGHMIADTPEELHAMALRIGLHTTWVQVSKHGALHYDLVPSKRRLAIQYGAMALSRKDFVAKLRTART